MGCPYGKARTSFLLEYTQTSFLLEHTQRYVRGQQSEQPIADARTPNGVLEGPPARNLRIPIGPAAGEQATRARPGSERECSMSEMEKLAAFTIGARFG
jgi:hypothetical protein